MAVKSFTSQNTVLMPRDTGPRDLETFQPQSLKVIPTSDTENQQLKFCTLFAESVIHTFLLQGNSGVKLIKL